MRLLNVLTLVVEEFPNNASIIPPYAILSHTWTNDEITLQDLKDPKDIDSLKLRKGFFKIEKASEQAKDDGLCYIWIDTCCIDKTSSAELMAAINSMFSWYKGSVICYAYLEDVDAIQVQSDPTLLCRSRWFTRGWTLQELIAPSTLVFFATGWQDIGTRDFFQDAISAITGIGRDLFIDGKLFNYSVAQRMSWAANRETTRIEDQAYCLLGIFGVTMPLLYGEGQTAFIRLQEEIIKRLHDHSIFAWTMTDEFRPGADSAAPCGFLAPSPSCFADSKNVLIGEKSYDNLSFSLTNQGLEVTLEILGWSRETPLPEFEFAGTTSDGAPRITITPPGTLIALLNCSAHSGKRIGLLIDRVKGTEPFHRVGANTGPLYLTPDECKSYGDLSVRTIRLIGQDLERAPLRDSMKPTFFFVIGPGSGFNILRCLGSMVPNGSPGMFMAKLSFGTRAGIAFARGSSAIGMVISQSWDTTNWEPVWGTVEEVNRAMDTFAFRDESSLTSHSFWSVTFLRPGESPCSPLCVELSVDKKHHGFLGKIKLQVANEMGVDDAQVRNDIVSRSETMVGWSAPKVTRHASSLMAQPIITKRPRTPEDNLLLNGVGKRGKFS